MEKLSTFQSVRVSFDHSFNVSLYRFFFFTTRSALRVRMPAQSVAFAIEPPTFDSKFLILSDFLYDFPESVFFSVYFIPNFFVFSYSFSSSLSDFVYDFLLRILPFTLVIFSVLTIFSFNVIRIRI